MHCTRLPRVQWLRGAREWEREGERRAHFRPGIARDVTGGSMRQPLLCSALVLYGPRSGMRGVGAYPLARRRICERNVRSPLLPPVHAASGCGASEMSSSSPRWPPAQATLYTACARGFNSCNDSWTVRLYIRIRQKLITPSCDTLVCVCVCLWTHFIVN